MKRAASQPVAAAAHGPTTRACARTRLDACTPPTDTRTRKRARVAVAPCSHHHTHACADTPLLQLPDDVRAGVFNFLTYKDAAALRTTCAALRTHVAQFPWMDLYPVRCVDVAAWRACFPCAHALNVHGCDVDPVHLSPLRSVRTWGVAAPCGDACIYGGAYKPFQVLGTHMESVCPAPTGPHISGTHRYPHWRTPRGARAWAWLKSARVLVASHRRLAPSAFLALRNVEKLCVGGCGDCVTDAALTQLVNLRKLDVSGCTRVTGAGLRGHPLLTHLNVSGCVRLGAADIPRTLETLIMDDVAAHKGWGSEAAAAAAWPVTAFAGMPHLRALRMVACTAVPPAALRPLARTLRYLVVAYCTQLTDDALAPLHGLTHLDMSACAAVTAAALQGLTQLQWLDIRLCPTLDACDALATLWKLRKLYASERVPYDAIAHLGELRTLAMEGANDEVLGDVCVNMPYLQTLRCRAYPHTNTLELTDCSALRELCVRECTSVGDDFVHSLPTCLTSLVLADCASPALTDAALRAPVMRHLEELQLKGTHRFSQAALAVLLRECPHLTVTMPDGSIVRPPR